MVRTYESLAAQITPDSTVGLSEMSRLKRETVGQIAKRDAELAWRLAEGWSQGEPNSGLDATSRSLDYLLVALELAESNPAQAVRFADQSATTKISQTTIAFLQTVEKSDHAAARRFFLKLLEALAANTRVDASDLLLLGCYVFAPRDREPFPGSGASNGVTWALVGDLPVINIVGREPAVPLDEVRAYLRVSSTILVRPALTRKEKIFNYLAGYQLAPYIRLYFPSVGRDFELAMQALKPELPPEWTRPGSLTNLSPVRVKDVEESLRELERHPAASRRDGVALGLCHSACMRSDFEQAATYAQHITDLTARERVRSFISFYRTARLIEKADLLTARQVAGKMDAGAEAAVLWLAIGQRYQELKDRETASEAYIIALQLIRTLDSIERAPLLVALTSRVSQFDENLGRQILGESVEAFNSVESSAYRPFRWARSVRAGDREVEFSLRIKGLDSSFALIFERMAVADPDWITLEVLKLKNERVLSEAVVALSSSLLKSIKKDS
jgi:hypothetical protein